MTTGHSCATIAIISNGTSAYDGWYEGNVFGRYELTMDEIGGYRVYSVIIRGKILYLRYDASYELWVVSLKTQLILIFQRINYCFSKWCGDKITYYNIGKSVTGRF